MKKLKFKNRDELKKHILEQVDDALDKNGYRPCMVYNENHLYTVIKELEEQKDLRRSMGAELRKDVKALLENKNIEALKKKYSDPERSWYLIEELAECIKNLKQACNREKEDRDRYANILDKFSPNEREMGS